MPIRPECRKLYPPRKVWRAIRAAVQARAGDKCEGCGVPNEEIGWRDRENKWHPYSTQDEFDELVPGRVVQIICTVAHLDHDPRNNDGAEVTGRVKPLPDSNLRFWCQQCHNRHDRKYRGLNAAVTRDRKRGQERMFGGALPAQA